MNEAFDAYPKSAFFAGDGKKTIEKCFRAVLQQNIGNESMMLPDFRRLVEAAGIEWPTNTGMGNTFIYLWEQYWDNVQTNLKTHCKTRLRKFFKALVFELNDEATKFNYFNDLFGHVDARPYYDNDDVKNAVNYAYDRKDTTNGDAERKLRLGELLDELRDIGAPFDCNIKQFTKDNWFASMYMWIAIQRYIALYNQTYRDRRDKPQIKNFVVVPMCSFQRRHILIDTNALYHIVCKSNQVPKKLGNIVAKDGTRNWINVDSTEFGKNKIGSWNLFFDVDKILKLVHKKKEFDCQIVSDGVSASIRYLKPKHPPAEFTDDQVHAMYEAGHFTYATGIDPGMKTWCAVVRHNLITGEEVKANFTFYIPPFHYTNMNFVSFD